ncbi:MAG TPA: RNA polymerase sigma factor, partial [Planctomycetota bacterium]
MTRPLEIEELLSHAGWLRGLARSLVHEPAAAEDLVQDTWLAALRQPPGREPRAWLARVARNLAHNARRGAGRRTTREALAHEERPSASPPELLAEAEAQRLLAEAVTHLPEELRVVVVLHHFRGLDSAAIGRELGLSPSAVRTRLQRALEALRRELDRRFGGERRAWSALLAPYAGLPASGGALVGVALAAAGLLVVAAGWWSLRELGRDDERALRAGALASRTAPAALGDVPSGAESGGEVAPSKRSVVLTGPAEVPEPGPLPDIEGRVLVDGAEPGRPVALEVHFVEQRDHPTTGTRARVRSDVRKLLTDARGRFDAFALGPECTFRVKTPEFLVEAPETRWETPARGLVVELRTPPRLRGRVVTGDGEPVHGTAGVTWLQAEVEDWQMFSGPLDVDCDAEGRFEVSLLGLMSEGTPETCSAELLLEIPRVGRGHVESGSFPLADHDLGTLVLEPVRVLRFRVRDGRGQPLAGAVARLDDLWLSKPSSPTNGEGFGELRHAPDRAVDV